MQATAQKRDVRVIDGIPYVDGKPVHVSTQERRARAARQAVARDPSSCPACKGTGTKGAPSFAPCKSCGGSGKR